MFTRGSPGQGVLNTAWLVPDCLAVPKYSSHTFMRFENRTLAGRLLAHLRQDLTGVCHDSVVSIVQPFENQSARTAQNALPGKTQSSRARRPRGAVERRVFNTEARTACLKCRGSRSARLCYTTTQGPELEMPIAVSAADGVAPAVCFRRPPLRSRSLRPVADSQRRTSPRPWPPSEHATLSARPVPQRPG
ncbi:hypothetical protein D9M68_147880 [compost metagenome]